MERKGKKPIHFSTAVAFACGKRLWKNAVRVPSVPKVDIRGQFSIERSAGVFLSPQKAKGFCVVFHKGREKNLLLVKGEIQFSTVSAGPTIITIIYNIYIYLFIDLRERAKRLPI